MNVLAMFVIDAYCYILGYAHQDILIFSYCCPTEMDSYFLFIADYRVTQTNNNLSGDMFPDTQHINGIDVKQHIVWL